MDFKSELSNKTDVVEKRLREILTLKYPEIIYEAMSHSVFAGGKRLRPIIMLSACECAGGSIDDAIDFACAIELIHTYSLIHDDLPAMDNDDFRRGKPTCHKVFGEDIAILAGDALLNKAFEIMSSTAVLKNDIKYTKAMAVLADAAGTNGMVGGQVVDVTSENKKIGTETLLYIHEKKTAALITAAVVCGAIIGGASEENSDIFRKIGKNIGIAFQIKDDILDITSSTEILGKPVFSDEKNNKTTYATMFGIEKSEKDLKKMSLEAVDMLDKFGKNSEFLKNYFIKLVDRIR